MRDTGPRISGLDSMHRAVGNTQRFADLQNRAAPTVVLQQKRRQLELTVVTLRQSRRGLARANRVGLLRGGRPRQEAAARGRRARHAEAAAATNAHGCVSPNA